MTTETAEEKERLKHASEVSNKDAIEALPQEGKTPVTIGNAALVIQLINGLDILLTFAGIVPPGTVPTVVNGIVAIGAGITQWWAKRKAVKVALLSSPSRVA